MNFNIYIKDRKEKIMLWIQYKEKNSQKYKALI